MGVFSAPAGSGAPVSARASERAECVFTERRQRGLDNKNRPLNTVITIQLRSLPLFQLKTLNGFLLSAGLRGRGAFCQIVSFGLVSVIRRLAGGLAGNDELAFSEKARTLLSQIQLPVAKFDFK